MDGIEKSIGLLLAEFSIVHPRIEKLDEIKEMLATSI